MTYDKASFLAGLRTGLALPRVPKPKPQATYLTFRNEDSIEFTLSVYNRTKNWDGTLYYSTDAENWIIWDGTTTLHSNNGVLYLRGSGNSRITGNSVRYRWVLVLPTGKQIQCIGNIENLLDWRTVSSGQHPQMEEYCYAHMFNGCRCLTSAPSLPSTTLAEYCYEYMFRYCTGLTSAPSLPATTLAEYCYAYMFDGCTCLTNAPELPATTLAEYCYLYMFGYCSRLTSAPSLPATTLAFGCYAAMFFGCTGLTSAPSLPATTLAEYCYEYMFWGCTGLISAPSLPATTLADSCYDGMFWGCTGLISAPSLPATTLADSCYDGMFWGCISLKLSATQDTTYLYPYRIPTSGTGTTANNALANMFTRTGGPFTGTPEINTTYYTDHPPILAE